MNNSVKKISSPPGKEVPSMKERGWREVFFPEKSWGEASSSENSCGEILNIGIIGAGSFAAFAIKSFLQIPGVKIIAVTDIDNASAWQMAKENDAKVYADVKTFLEDENIDLVYIATPPFLHYEQSKMALIAGKHVICEKPAALKTSEAEELCSLAASPQLLYVVNLMQRYNPLYGVVNKIVKQKILGNFLHGFFENYASDENLAPGHWFWDETKSGGIFIEHGVHFFDMFSGWLGEGKVVNALQLQRRGVEEKITDRVQSTVLYEEGTVNFYHGFDQPKILDRQEMRLEFERGEITLYEWVPVKMRLHGLIKNEQLEYLKEIIGDCEVVYNAHAQTKNQKVKGRFAKINFDKEITLECGDVTGKQHRYGQLLTSMLTDQWNWIQDSRHKRIIDESNAVESLRMAEEATKISLKF
ncbi:MAG: Gfo/Idh/MocA family oxidoreductase [Ginsengibacter sp.]